MAVTVYKSTDANAPSLASSAGQLIDVLDACLVNGYGSVHASGSLIYTVTNPNDGDTITIGSIVYRFKNTLAQAYDVHIDASSSVTWNNFRDAIDDAGTIGSEYFAGTLAHPDVIVTSANGLTPRTTVVSARKGGAAGNSIALAKSGAQFTVSGATLSGGSGTDTKLAAGWTKPYAPNPYQAVYCGGSGVQHYYHVDDNGPNTTARGREAQFRGSEAATGFQAGITNYFPTTAQFALLAGLVIRKCSTFVDSTTPVPWILVADDRTAWLFIQTGDVAGWYYAVGFGEMFSILTGTDLYRSLVIGRIAANTGLTGSEVTPQLAITLASVSGHYMARSYTGLGGSIAVGKFGDVNRSNATLTMGADGLATPNPADGAIHISPVHVCEPTAPAVRGRLRGLYHLCHQASAFADGDTITGSGAYAGRTFLCVKTVVNTAGTQGVACIDITGPWETN